MVQMPYNVEKYLVTTSGVKVYRKPEYHPLLSGTDLSHPDFLRKLSERFPKHIADGLPRICSENSEDARTWHHFSPLLSATREDKNKWIETFLTKAFENTPESVVPEIFQDIEILFWRGREVSPYFDPPPNLEEGRTEVDVSIVIPDVAIIFVEAKYKSPISTGTTHDVSRDQVIRNIDVGSLYAQKKEYAFYFILLTAEEDKTAKNMLDFYRNNSREIIKKLPHRVDIMENVSQLVKKLGYITWNKIPTIT